MNLTGYKAQNKLLDRVIKQEGSYNRRSKKNLIRHLFQALDLLNKYHKPIQPKDIQEYIAQVNTLLEDYPRYRLNEIDPKKVNT